MKLESLLNSVIDELTNALDICFNDKIILIQINMIYARDIAPADTLSEKVIKWLHHGEEYSIEIARMYSDDVAFIFKSEKGIRVSIPRNYKL